MSKATCRVSLLAAAYSALMIGCQGAANQSALHPAGPAAAEIAWLWWAMFAAFTAVFVLSIVLLIVAVVKRTSARSSEEATDPPLGRTGFIVAGGVVLPVIVLTPLYLLSFKTPGAIQTPEDALRIRVVGRMWWWEVRYPEQGIVTANEIHIPAGEPVRLELTSADVIHSFWVPSLNGKRDMLPGMETSLWIQADEPGVYRGQCAEYCGDQHAKMAFLVVALPPDEFRPWTARRQAAHAAGAMSSASRGRAVFMKAGCVQCHDVDKQATEPESESSDSESRIAKVKIGPDLTHISSRRTIGAGLLPNTSGNLARWIADPQAFKPGAKMPRTKLAGKDLEALVEYLESRQ